MSQDFFHLGPKNLIVSSSVVPICDMAFLIDNYRRTETEHPKLPYQLTLGVGLCPGYVLRIFAFPEPLPIIKRERAWC